MSSTYLGDMASKLTKIIETGELNKGEMFKIIKMADRNYRGGIARAMIKTGELQSGELVNLFGITDRNSTTAEMIIETRKLSIKEMFEILFLTESSGRFITADAIIKTGKLIIEEIFKVFNSKDVGGDFNIVPAIISQICWEKLSHKDILKIIGVSNGNQKITDMIVDTIKWNKFNNEEIFEIMKVSGCHLSILGRIEELFAGKRKK